MEEEKQEEKQEEKPISNDRILLLAVGIVALVVGGIIGSNFFPNQTGLTVLPEGGDAVCNGNGVASLADESTVGEKVVNYLNDNFLSSQGFSAELSSVEEFNDFLYMVNFDILSDGQKVQSGSVHTTKDGKILLLGQLFDLDTPLPQPEPEPEAEAEPAVEIPKTDKLVFELFVMSHCPFGTQAEKGALPVVELLGDKIDFKIRFVHYIMHGEKEAWEEARQYCIQEEQTEKYLDYLSCFLEDGDSERCLAEAEIDTDALDACVEAADTEFSITDNLNDTSARFPAFNINADLSDAYGVGGSPTFVINETKLGGNACNTDSDCNPSERCVNTGYRLECSQKRDSASILLAVCSAFNNPPEECNTELSTETPSSGFGYDGSSTSSGSCG